MKFDPHKAKAARKWKSKNAAPQPPSSRPPQKPDDESSDEAKEVDAEGRSKWARRKLTSNAFRYEEPGDDEELEEEEKEAREAQKLANLVKQSAEKKDASSYFRFSAEKDWFEGDDSTEASAFDDLFKLDIEALETVMYNSPLTCLLNGESVVKVPMKKKDAFLDTWEYSAEDDGKGELPRQQVQTIKADDIDDFLTSPTKPTIPPPKTATPINKNIARKPAIVDDADAFLFNDDKDIPSIAPASKLKAATGKAQTAEKDDLDWLDDMLSK
ncbi:hypothetical protein BC829DRAFT_400742 [Chytridium lagenaria]|nr:hypothetical protein BC829DRAFT_400742 [Chytridium lagenaria]